MKRKFGDGRRVLRIPIADQLVVSGQFAWHDVFVPVVLADTGPVALGEFTVAVVDGELLGRDHVDLAVVDHHEGLALHHLQVGNRSIATGPVTTCLTATGTAGDGGRFFRIPHVLETAMLLAVSHVGESGQTPVALLGQIA